MFLNSKQQKAVEFCITVLESQGLEVRYPDLETNHSKVNISEIRWRAKNREGKTAAHILLTKWNKRFKVVLWLPKDPDADMTAIDPYVVLSQNKTHLILPYGQGQLSLGKTDPNIFMTLEEMRDYLGY